MLLKLMKSCETMEQALKEAKLLANLRHQNVLALYVPLVTRALSYHTCGTRACSPCTCPWLPRPLVTK